MGINMEFEEEFDPNSPGVDIPAQDRKNRIRQVKIRLFLKSGMQQERELRLRSVLGDRQAVQGLKGDSNHSHQLGCIL